MQRQFPVLARLLSLHSPFPFMVMTMKCAKRNQRSIPLMLSSTVKRFAIAAAIASFGPSFAFSADDEMLRVSMNQARVLKLDRAVSKVIVGNSKVADATVADATTIVLTGRSFGTTNLVLLDAEGNAIVDERVLVSIDEGNTVRVYRQTSRSVLSCSPACEEHAQN
ncbi:Flp pilus assembly secretin CpaC [Agrobacterium larrymoorei]|uniref:Flp pilus assembly secretin CpaC n=2 Tax=Agrobacterium larrymoorei TaxID=160699 RepID=A0AAJ2EWP4_9HYPH|nr:Flp pilus assembly secretin CpaC [Agrobacterium larrymoorei]